MTTGRINQVTIRSLSIFWSLMTPPLSGLHHCSPHQRMSYSNNLSVHFMVTHFIAVHHSNHITLGTTNINQPSLFTPMSNSHSPPFLHHSYSHTMTTLNTPTECHSFSHWNLTFTPWHIGPMSRSQIRISKRLGKQAKHAKMLADSK